MGLDSNDSNELKEKLGEIFGILPEKVECFQIALTHSSYTRENNISSLKNYERLEFLGDAVLKLCISDILYKKFPKYPEGDLTKIRSIIVSDNVLAEVSIKIKLQELLILGSQEEKMGGRKKSSIIACAFEAVLGAYYVNGEYEGIKNFLEKVMMPYIIDVDENFEKFNAKALLQEYTQSKDKKTPEYKIVKEKGPAHKKTFVVGVYYNERELAVAEGKTKKEAEQNCAYKACVGFGIIKDS
jgi:ribonuclease-3